MFDLRDISHWAVAPRYDGNSCFFSLFTGFYFVSKHIEVLGGRSDKDDAFLFTPLGKLNVFRQEAVARMDGIHMVAFRNLDDPFNIKISINRLFPFADQVCFIGFVSVV